MAWRSSCLACCLLVSIVPAIAREGDRRHGSRDREDNCENSSAFVCPDGSEANMSAEPPCFSGRPKCSNRTYAGQNLGRRNVSGARREGRDAWNCSNGSAPTCPDGAAPNFSNELPCSAGRPSCPNQTSPHETGARGRRRGRREGEHCNCTDGSTPICPDGSEANMSAEPPCLSGRPKCSNRTYAGQNLDRRNSRSGRRDAGDSWNCSDGSSPSCPDGAAPNFSNEVPCSAGRLTCPNQSFLYERGARGRRRGRGEGEHSNCTDGFAPICPDGSEPADNADKPCVEGRPKCANGTGQWRGDRSRAANRDEGERDRLRGNRERGGARTEGSSEFTESGNTSAQESHTHTEAAENGESDMVALLVGVGVGAIALLVGVCVTIRASRWHMTSKQSHCHVDKHGVSEVKGSPTPDDTSIKASDIVTGQPVKSTLQVAETKCLDDAV